MITLTFRPPAGVPKGQDVYPNRSEWWGVGVGQTVNLNLYVFEKEPSCGEISPPDIGKQNFYAILIIILILSILLCLFKIQIFGYDPSPVLVSKLWPHPQVTPVF